MPSVYAPSCSLSNSLSSLCFSSHLASRGVTYSSSLDEERIRANILFEGTWKLGGYSAFPHWYKDDNGMTLPSGGGREFVEQLLDIADRSDTLPWQKTRMTSQVLSELDRRLLRLLLDGAGAAFRGYAGRFSDHDSESRNQKEGKNLAPLEAHAVHRVCVREQDPVVQVDNSVHGDLQATCHIRSDQRHKVPKSFDLLAVRNPPRPGEPLRQVDHVTRQYRHRVHANANMLLARAGLLTNYISSMHDQQAKKWKRASGVQVNIGRDHKFMCGSVFGSSSPKIKSKAAVDRATAILTVVLPTSLDRLPIIANNGNRKWRPRHPTKPGGRLTRVEQKRALSRTSDLVYGLKVEGDASTRASSKVVKGDRSVIDTPDTRHITLYRLSASTVGKISILRVWHVFKNNVAQVADLVTF
ncbi:hypothetical protein L210DRAFT_3509691 [Boletus edulis BED1]|uniref:Uncharacterized protein n=1 Tax=Boletus edulis BED1 TaxID=1328754 RepID=A0AAD4G6X3_BOLED|nr:hypothetical protein L210DRAFT_3509691 [Boletus edulis BED1]